jgi:hypothetical protein
MEPGQRRLAAAGYGEQFGGDSLDHDRSFEGEVPRLPDLAHHAAPEY